MRAERRHSNTPQSVFRTLQNRRRWKMLGVLDLKSDPTLHHPQGIKVIGQHLYISTVDKVNKRALLFKFRLSLEPMTDLKPQKNELGRALLVATLVLSETEGLTKLFHCGGMEWDGQHLLIPLSEYRAYSESRIVRVDPETFRVVDISPRYLDHFGALAIVHGNNLADPPYPRRTDGPERRRTPPAEAHHAGGMVAANWDSKNFYFFERPGEPGRLRPTTPPETGDLNPLGPLQPIEFVAYQDCKQLGASHFICGGKLKGFFKLERGVLDLIKYDAERRELRRIHRVIVSNFTPQGRRSWSPITLPLTHNTFDYQFNEERGTFRFFFAPHDGPNNKLFIFEAHSSLRQQILQKLKSERD